MSGGLKSGRIDLRSIIRLLASGFGLGYLPFAPGTWGSLGAVVCTWVFCLWFPQQAWTLWAFLLGVLAAAGIWISSMAASWAGDADPSFVVIDEIVGQFLCLLIIPYSISYSLLAFFVFRLFDVLKPFPVGLLEKLPRGWGIVADDLGAGLYAGGTVLLIDWAWKAFMG